MRIIIDNENSSDFDVDIATNEKEKDFETFFNSFSHAISRAIIEFIDANAEDCYAKFEYGDLLHEDIQMRLGEWLDQISEKDREKEQNNKTDKQYMTKIFNLRLYKK